MAALTMANRIAADAILRDHIIGDRGDEESPRPREVIVPGKRERPGQADRNCFAIIIAP